MSLLFGWYHKIYGSDLLLVEVFHWMIFWPCRMSFQDFTNNFQKVEMCNLGPDAAGSTGKITFETTTQEGCWKRRVNAGGCRNYLGQFCDKVLVLLSDEVQVQGEGDH